MNVVADFVNPKTGRTYREENAEKRHWIAIGTLVELNSGCRLFVASHSRDCDQTPLYELVVDNGESEPVLCGGYSDKSLRLVTKDMGRVIAEIVEEVANAARSEAAEWKARAEEAWRLLIVCSCTCGQPRERILNEHSLLCRYRMRMEEANE